MMTVKKVWCILVLVVSVLPAQGFSLITSRIQGKVKDFNTGEPIGGAKVLLFYSSNYSGIFIKRHEFFTDDKGGYRFSLLEKGFYYLGVYKKGYADFGPFFEYHIRWIEDRVYYSNRFKVDTHLHDKERIDLKEGEIKHVEILLKKEAIVQIRFISKTINGIEPLTFEIAPGVPDSSLSNFSAKISFIDEKYPTIRPNAAKKDVGTMVFNSLPPGNDIRVHVRANGYPSKMYTITLGEGKTHVIEHLLDFTTGQVVYGIITDKDTGKPLYGVEITIYNENISGEKVFYETDITGKYWIGGFIPGKYRMYITPANKDEVLIPFEINKNQKIEINRQF